MVARRSTRYRRAGMRGRPRVAKATQKVRKLAGQRPITAIEHLAGYGKGIGAVAKVVSQMYGMINSEVKFVDTSASGTVDNTPSYVISPTAIGEGDDETQRNGRFILSKAIHGRFNVNVPTAQLAPVRMGFALIMDKEPQLGAQSWVSLYGSSDPNALINKATNSDRFVVLRRWNFTSNPNSVISKDFKFFINLKGIHLKYKGTTSTDYEKNAIFLVGTSTVATNLPSVTGNLRYEFYDN